MNKTQQVRVIKEAFRAIPDLYDGFWNVRDRLYDMNLEAERRHRHGAHPPCFLTIKDAARLFTVQHLLDGWNAPNRWTVDDILHIRTECLYAQAYGKRHRAELKAWADEWTAKFEEVDYAELMKGAAWSSSS